MSLPHKTVEGWLVLRAKRSSWATYSDNSPFKSQAQIDSVVPVKITQSKPALDPDQIAIKVEFDIAPEHFLEANAVIKASIPDTSVATTITATVDHPVKGRSQSSAVQAIHGKP